jgi:membrane protein DedA with SNARE-associated domain
VTLALVDSVLDLVRPLYAGWWAYLLIGTVILLDRGAFVGLVVPGDLFLALGGIYAGRHDLSIVAVIAVAFVAAIAGESVSFWIGRRHGIGLVRHLPLANRLETKLDGARDYFRRHGGKTVFIGRYVSVAGTFVPFAAGMSEMRYRHFLLFDAVAVAVWATAVALLGYFLSARVDLVDTILSRFGWGLLALLVLLIVGRFVWKRRDALWRWARAKWRALVST